MQTQATHDRKFDNDGAAEYLGVAPTSLRTWRCTRAVQIPYAKIGRRVVYWQSDLDNFLDKNIVGSDAA